MTSTPDIPDDDQAWRKFRGQSVWWLVLVFVLLVAAGLFLQFWLPWRMQQNIVKRIQSYGGDVSYREVGPEWFRSLTRGRGSVSGGGLLDQVTVVRICPAGAPRSGRVEISPELIHELHRLPELSRLDLSYTNVTDDWMSDISNLRSLQRLDLGHTRICGRGFPQLSKLPDLASLDVVFCPIRDQYLNAFTRAPSLKSVNLHSCSHLTPEAVADVAMKRPDCRFHSPPKIR